MVGNTISGFPQPQVAVQHGASASVTQAVATPPGAPVNTRFQQLAVFGSPTISTLTRQLRELAPDTSSIARNISVAARLVPTSAAPITAQLLAQQSAADTPQTTNAATGQIQTVNARAQSEDQQIQETLHFTLGTLATLASLQKKEIASGKFNFYVQPHLLPQSSIVRDTKGSVYAGSAALAYSYAGTRLYPKPNLFTEEDVPIKA